MMTGVILRSAIAGFVLRSAFVFSARGDDLLATTALFLGCVGLLLEFARASYAKGKGENK